MTIVMAALRFGAYSRANGRMAAAPYACAHPVPPFFCHMKFHCRKRRLRRSAAVVKIMTVERDAAEGGRDGRTGVCGTAACARSGTDGQTTDQGREERRWRRVGENVVIHIALSRKLFLT